MAQSIRQIARGAAFLAASALTVSAAGVASAQEADAYPDPTVSAEVDGNNIITTITDNGGGVHNGLPVICLNLGLDALEALPLAALDPDEVDVGHVLDVGLWGGTLWITSDEEPEIVVSAEDNLANDWDELPAGVYASVGACLSIDLDTGDMTLESMDYAAPIFVPGGIGSVGQALDLGSSALSLEGGSSILMDVGSDMAGS